MSTRCAFSIALSCWAFMGCAEGEPPKVPASQAASATKTVSDTAASPAESGSDAPTCEDVACASSSECCEGYACGFDPERSRVQRYCLAQ